MFRLSEEEMDAILREVLSVVKDWRSIAKRIGISRMEQSLMERAFNYLFPIS